ncbi:MAG: hypothetical protein RMK18_05245 [Armatimonadota bacterium]|nr:hypothetical protein [Armatimonadota bacterium]MCX7776600.1 hypothetical protein [Armatimonadota bacterium]MDW8025257.1 hypothetical protein [Armatimonadota bacterium]
MKRSKTSIGHLHCLSLYGVLGFCSMVVQATLVREFLAVIYGTELSLGMLFASWLLWIAIGAELGAYIAPRVRNPVLSFSLWLLVVACLLPAQIAFIRSMHLILRTPPGELPSPLSTILYVLVALSPFSLAVGFTFPLGVRIYRTVGQVTARPVAWIYAVEALGSLFGGCAFTFLLVRIMPACFLMALVSCMLCGASASLIYRITKDSSLKLALSAAALLPAIIQASFAMRLERALTVLRWNSYGTGNELVLSMDSPYQNIAIGKRLDQYSLFCDGHFVTSFPDEYTNSSLALLLVSQADKPSKVLIVGGGIEGLLSQLLEIGVEQIEYVQTDPWLIDALMPFLPERDKMALSSKMVLISHSDARQFIRETRKSYDLIFLHIGDPSTAQLNRYYTVEFFRLVKKRLSEMGVFALHITGSESYLGEALAHYVGSVYHTLKASFKHIAVSVGETMFMFASDHNFITESPTELMERATRIVKGISKRPSWMTSRSISAATMPPQVLLSYFPPLRSEWLHNEMQKLREKSGAKGRLINSDLHPVSYFHYLRLWLHKSHPQAMLKIEGWIEGHMKWLLVAVAVLFGAMLLADAFIAQLRIASGRSSIGAAKRASLIAASFAGMTAMGLELILLVAFQSLHSALYQMVGALVAVFMLGLALGSILIGRLQTHVHGRLQACLLLSCICTLIALFAISMPHLLSLIANWMTQTFLLLSFLSLLTISGFLTGAALPAAVGVYHAAMDESSKLSLTHAAGKVNRADHFGASLGALFVPVLLFPLLGLSMTCNAIGALNLFSGVLTLCSSAPLLLIKRHAAKGGF